MRFDDGRLLKIFFGRTPPRPARTMLKSFRDDGCHAAKMRWPGRAFHRARQFFFDDVSAETLECADMSAALKAVTYHRSSKPDTFRRRSRKDNIPLSIHRNNFKSRFKSRGYFERSSVGANCVGLT